MLYGVGSWPRPIIWISDVHARPKFTHYGTSGSPGAAVGAQAISEATEMPLEAHGAPSTPGWTHRSETTTDVSEPRYYCGRPQEVHPNCLRRA